MSALAVEGFSLAYRARGLDRIVLRDVSFQIGTGESYGLVGESGCGKSTLALAAMRHPPANARVLGGRIVVAGQDVFALGDEALRTLRADDVAIVTQDPAKALNPTLRIGIQIGEIFRLHGVSAEQAAEHARAMLRRVRIADPDSVAGRYPHQLSGGMQQRIAIAMALSTAPRLLILDEPTTGLDATVEAEILDLIGELRRDSGTAILLISHNLAVVSQICDRVGILYAGTLVEEGPTATTFGDPRHPYTVGLLRCLPMSGRRKDHGRLDTIPGFPPEPGAETAGCLFAPRCGLADERCRRTPPALAAFGDRLSRCHYPDLAPALPRMTPADTPAPAQLDRAQPPLLSLRDLGKSFGDPRRPARALSGVSLDLWPGETLGLVGESGSGKTTLARLLLGLTAPDPGGVIELDGRALAGRAASRRPEQLKAIQIVFQNPDSALNRSHTVRRLIGRVLTTLAAVPRPALPARLLALISSVQLAPAMLDLKPPRLSGGLKQRVAIARAFAGEPRIVVCDEPTSALDVSVQAAILNLLAELQAKRQVSYVFISHDLATVRYLSDRVAVLYLGRLMEIGPAERLFAGPRHPYTEALLSAAPDLGGEVARRRLAGDIPSAIDPPSGCVFHTRCPRKLGPICEREEPPFLPGVEDGHAIRCHIPAGAL